MKKLKDRIIQEWLKTKTIEVHPSYRQLGKKFKCNPAYCFKVIKDYLEKGN